MRHCRVPDRCAPCDVDVTSNHGKLNLQHVAVVAAQVHPSYGKTATCQRWPRAAHVANSSISVQNTATDGVTGREGAHAPQQGKRQAATPVNGAPTAEHAVLQKQQHTPAYSLLAPISQPIIGVSKQSEKLEREVIQCFIPVLPSAVVCSTAFDGHLDSAVCHALWILWHASHLLKHCCSLWHLVL
jgi:hypothetical protein